MTFLEHLRCPITKNDLTPVGQSDFSRYGVSQNPAGIGNIHSGLMDSTRKYFYPIINDIIVLHQHYALHIGDDEDLRTGLSFDKQRVFDYYNELDYRVKDALSVYEDSAKWVDFRQVASGYIRHSFTRAARFYPATGRYLLDIASGPIGLPEYMALSDGYEYRVCVDISIKALAEAKANMERAGKKGIFICGDITNIPIKDNACGTVLSQHTLYHVPKRDQLTAVNEMYRVAKASSKIVIIYSWFWHSWFMNLSLHVVQLYRIVRHLAGKLFVRLFKSKPRLYFYAHSPRWFRKTFPFGKDIEFYCWRSTNKHFMNLYIHKWLFGRRILKRLTRIEDKHSRFMGRFGEYPAIVITKRPASSA